MFDPKHKIHPKTKKNTLFKTNNKWNLFNVISRKTKKKQFKIIEYRKKSIPKSLKKMVWDKYIGADIGKSKCMCCKYQDVRQIEFHCGHVIAEANGGETNINNLRPICAQCNLSMGKMNMDVFMKKYMHNKN
jgi:5-methylcytosine-specific restriction endonuclease McrA